jgi:hypothetical protein
MEGTLITPVSVQSIRDSAFRQLVLQGTALQKMSRVGDDGAFLPNALKINGDAPKPWFDFRFRAKMVNHKATR